MDQGRQQRQRKGKQAIQRQTASAEKLAQIPQHCGKKDAENLQPKNQRQCGQQYAVEAQLAQQALSCQTYLGHIKGLGG